MKKVVLLLAIVLMVGGMVWAQIPNPPAEPGPFGSPGRNPFGFVYSAVDATGFGSTEDRYSSGRYSSDVDDFIDATWHNPNIGTFAVLGGYPAAGTVDQTNVLTPTTPYAISFGFGKTFSAFYLGVYYAGSLVNANGFKTPEEDTSPDDLLYKYSEADWYNNIALLFGIAGMGFRLDIVGLDGKAVYRESVDGSLAAKYSEGGAVALSWGTVMGNLAPGLQIGFKFPDTIVVTDADIDNKADKKMTITQNGGFSLQANAWYGLSDPGSIWTSLTFATASGNRYKGDTADLHASNSDPWKEGGAWGLDWYIHYQHELDFGKFGMKIRPRLDINFISENFNTTQNDNSDKLPTDNYFSLGTAVDFGFKYQANDKFAFYTAFGLNLFGWRTFGHSGGDDKDEHSQWEVTGISWIGSWHPTGSAGWWSNSPDSSTLGLGMTWTPVKGLVIGTGLNTLLNKIVEVDVRSMQVRGGTWFTDSGANNIGDWAFNLFSGLEFDLTVSYTF